MKLETAIEQLLTEFHGSQHADKAGEITKMMQSISGGSTTVSDAKFKKLMTLGRKLKQMGIK